jgi:hypothetical protein
VLETTGNVEQKSITLETMGNMKKKTEKKVF